MKIDEICDNCRYLAYRDKDEKLLCNESYYYCDSIVRILKIKDIKSKCCCNNNFLPTEELLIEFYNKNK